MAAPGEGRGGRGGDEGRVILLPGCRLRVVGEPGQEVGPEASEHADPIR